MHDHLNNVKFYKKVKENPLKDLQTNLEAFLETIFFHYHIERSTYNFLLPPVKPRTNLFYILPKLHKPDIPGRPIISSVNSVTENISEFLTKCIRPLTLKLKSHIKDTKDFLQTILYTSSKNIKYLVTIDVTSLYTNIPHNEGIDACIHYLEKYDTEVPSFTPNKTILRTLFLFVLENNYFLFKDTMYKQISGTAMGTKMAPPYADLFLGKFEEDHILKSLFASKIHFYKRFLDDIFLLWGGTLTELTQFMRYINNLHPTIKFTYSYSETEINFLDTTIYKERGKNRFKSKIYKKPTDTNSLLHFSSYHPPHTKENIIYTQALRYRLLTTNNNQLKYELNSLKKNFILRGYPNNIIDRNFKKIQNLTQRDILFKTSKQINIKPSLRVRSKNNLPFIIKYYEHLTPLNKILNKHWDIIKSDPQLKKIYPKRPFVVYKRHKNLKDILVKTRYSK